MRFAAIADIHGNTAALRAVLDDIARRGIAETVNLGDSLSGPLDPAGTMDLLLAADLPTVCGNHDRALIEGNPELAGLWEQWALPELAPCHLDWVRGLPATLRWNGVFLCHATPESDTENWLDFRGANDRLLPRDHDAVEARARGAPADVPLILCGHTHSPRMVRLSDGRIVANPGSVGMPAYLDDRFDPPFIHQTGAPDARYAICDLVDGDWRIDLVSVPYDSAEMQALARSKGGDSWADALAGGWFTPPV